MSRTTLYRVYKTTATPIAEYGNSWGSAPALWNLIWSQHVERGEPFPMWKILVGEGTRLWRCAERADVPFHRRLALAFTFDNAIVRPSNTALVADALDKTHLEILSLTQASWSHFAAIADGMRAAKIDKRCLGLGLGCTSVCDPWENGNRAREPWDSVAYVRSSRKTGKAS